MAKENIRIEYEGPTAEELYNSFKLPESVLGTGKSESARSFVVKQGDVLYVGDTMADLEKKILAGVDGFPVERFRRSPFVPPGVILKVTPPSFDEMMNLWKPLEPVTKKWEVFLPAPIRMPVLNVQLCRYDMTPQYRVTGEMVSNGAKQVLYVGAEFATAIDYLRKLLPAKHPGCVLKDTPRRQWLKETIYALDMYVDGRWNMRITVESVFLSLTIKGKKKNCNSRRKK